MLGLYKEYNKKQDAFDKKWGTHSDNYLEKVLEIKGLLPELEKNFDETCLEKLRQRIVKEEKTFKEWQQKLKGGWTWDEKAKMDAEEARLEKLQFHPSLEFLEEAFQKKWTPRQKEEEEIEHQRRVDEGKIQFLTTLIERERIDRASKRSLDWDEIDTLYKRNLTQLKKEFVGKYGDRAKAN